MKNISPAEYIASHPLHPIKLLEHDGMPKEVATEILCGQKRITNRERKVCRSARENHFVSTRQRLPVEQKLAGHFHAATISQLIKWNARSVRRYLTLQKAYAKAQAKEESPLRDRLLAELDIRAQSLTLIRDGTEDEVASRFARASQSKVCHVHPQHLRPCK